MKSEKTISSTQPLLIAPFLSGQYFCDEAIGNPNVRNEDEAALFSALIGKNAGKLITTTLDKIGPKVSPNGKYQLGYTLNVPLMRYFIKTDGHWFIDKNFLKKNIETIIDVDRPVVIYLSANHFTDTNHELIAELSRDQRNLMWNRNGPMNLDDYFNHPIVPWILCNKEAPINIMRREVFTAAVRILATLPTSAQEKIVAISLLGEVHDMFPKFLETPNFGVKMYEATDYSPVSIQGFRNWLSQKFTNIEAINVNIGGNFTSLEEIVPPSKDIRHELLNHFFEHIDTYASGHVPIYGWIHDQHNRTLVVDVYLNGKKIGTSHTGLSRTDVTDAIPKITDPNVGFRFDMDFRNIPTGIHTLEILVSINNQQQLILAKRNLCIFGGDHSTPPPIHYAGDLRKHVQSLSSDQSLSGNLDGPDHLQSIFYNPLARLWLKYRNQVIRNYIEQFAQIAIQEGIPREKIFSHQLTPHLYGSWNADLVATDAVQQPSALYNQGGTLYGGTAFGCAFKAMTQQFGWDRYGINEMHPIVPLKSSQYLSMFEMHHKNGAVFVAPYYMSILPNRLPSGSDLDRFRIAPDNPRCGSNFYWQSIKDVMNQ